MAAVLCATAGQYKEYIAVLDGQLNSSKRLYLLATRVIIAALWSAEHFKRLYLSARRVYSCTIRSAVQFKPLYLSVTRVYI